MRSVIFDFNGTMFLDEQKHIDSWRDFALEKFNYRLKDEDFPEHIHGHSNADILTFITGKVFSDEEVFAFAKEKELWYQKLCEEDYVNLHLTDGLTEFLDLLVENNVPIAIATASMKPNVDWYIKTFGLDKWFPLERIIYDDGTLTEGKPHPMIYNRAIGCLGTTPEECVVFEDAKAGLQSARSALVRYVAAVAPGSKKEIMRSYGTADFIIEDFYDIPSELISFLNLYC